MEESNLKTIREEYNVNIDELSEYSKIDLEILKKIEEKSEEELTDEEKIILHKVLHDLEIYHLMYYKKNKNLNYKDELEKEIFEEVKSYKKSQVKLTFIKSIILSLIVSLGIFIFEKSLFREEKEILQAETTLNTILSLEEKIKTLNIELEKQQIRDNEDKIRSYLEILNKKLTDEKLNVINQKLPTTDIISITTLIIGLVTFLISLLFKFDFLNDSIKTKEKIVERINVEELINDLDKDFDNNMIKINIYQLNAYNDQTKSQANKSFKIASITSVVGFILLCAGLILVFFKQDNAGYLATGIGLLIEFLSGVIFYLYNKTIIKMGEYHKKIVLTQNIALALKATNNFEPNKKMEIRGKIIEEILRDINKFLSEK